MGRGLKGFFFFSFSDCNEKRERKKETCVCIYPFAPAQRTHSVIWDGHKDKMRLVRDSRRALSVSSSIWGNMFLYNNLGIEKGQCVREKAII